MTALVRTINNCSLLKMDHILGRKGQEAGAGLGTGFCVRVGARREEEQRLNSLETLQQTPWACSVEPSQSEPSP